MDENIQASKPVRTTNPTELLSLQAQSLSELVDIQKAQKEQIAELQRQNERLVGLLTNMNRVDSDSGFTHVKIENINMPFGALVGFMVKVSLASIPAFLILLIIYAVIAFLLSSIFGIALGGFM
jgi:hypothetical protein